MLWRLEDDDEEDAPKTPRSSAAEPSESSTEAAAARVPVDALRLRFLKNPPARSETSSGGDETPPDYAVSAVIAPARCVAVRAPIARLVAVLARHKPAQTAEQDELLRQAVEAGASATANAARDRLALALADRPVVDVAIVVHAPKIAAPSDADAFLRDERAEASSRSRETLEGSSTRAAPYHTLLLDLGRFEMRSCSPVALGGAADADAAKRFDAFAIKVSDISASVAASASASDARALLDVSDDAAWRRDGRAAAAAPILPSFAADATLLRALAPTPERAALEIAVRADALRVAAIARAAPGVKRRPRAARGGFGARRDDAREAFVRGRPRRCLRGVFVDAARPPLVRRSRGGSGGIVRATPVDAVRRSSGGVHARLFRRGRRLGAEDRPRARVRRRRGRVAASRALPGRGAARRRRVLERVGGEDGVRGDSRRGDGRVAREPSRVRRGGVQGASVRRRGGEREVASRHQRRGEAESPRGGGAGRAGRRSFRPRGRRGGGVGRRDGDPSRGRPFERVQPFEPFEPFEPFGGVETHGDALARELRRRRAARVPRRFPRDDLARRFPRELPELRRPILRRRKRRRRRRRRERVAPVVGRAGRVRGRTSRGRARATRARRASPPSPRPPTAARRRWSSASPPSMSSTSTPRNAGRAEGR